MPCRAMAHLEQVWQAFVQESIRTVATTAGTDFEADLNIAIDEVS